MIERRPVIARVIFMVMMLCLVAGCGDPGVSDDQLRGAKPNVVLYCIDTLRAGHLGCYGYERDTTPYLDKISQESILFENAISQAPWTPPSVASFLTSTYPSTHQVLKGGRKISKEVVIMPEYFSEAGYWTAGFVQNMFGGSAIDADRGYRDFDESKKRKPGDKKQNEEDKKRGVEEEKADKQNKKRNAEDEGLNTEGEEETDNSRGIPTALNWIEKWTGDSPFFLYIHTTEPHYPYMVEIKKGFSEISREEKLDLNAKLSRFRKLTRKANGENAEQTEERQSELRRISDVLATNREKVIDLYDNEVKRADENVKKVVKALKKKGLWDNTIFILLSDHGQENYDHGYWQHDQSLYQELIHVPLIIKLPEGMGAGMKVQTPVELVDILPTLAQMLGLPPKPYWEGRSFLAMLQQGEQNETDVYAERINLNKHDPFIINQRGNVEVVLLRGRLKAVLHREVDRISLYDLARDPGEQNDLSMSMPKVAREMHKEIETWLQQRKPLEGVVESDLTPEQIENLRALGYLR